MTYRGGGKQMKQPPQVEYCDFRPQATGLLQQSLPNCPTTVVLEASL